MRPNTKWSKADHLIQRFTDGDSDIMRGICNSHCCFIGLRDDFMRLGGGINCSAAFDFLDVLGRPGQFESSGVDVVYHAAAMLTGIYRIVRLPAISSGCSVNIFPRSCCTTEDKPLK